MKMSTKVVLVTVVVTIVGFLTESNGPFGSFWAPVAGTPQPTGVQIPLFMVLGAVEALALGLGVSFFLFGFSALQARTSVSPSLTRAAHLAISWILANWWAHDSLHIHNGMNLNGLLGIEYGFHVTLIISGLIVMRFFMAVVQTPAGMQTA